MKKVFNSLIFVSSLLLLMACGQESKKGTSESNSGSTIQESTSSSLSQPVESSITSEQIVSSSSEDVSSESSAVSSIVEESTSSSIEEVSSEPISEEVLSSSEIESSLSESSNEEPISSSEFESSINEVITTSESSISSEIQESSETISSSEESIISSSSEQTTSISSEESSTSSIESDPSSSEEISGDGRELRENELYTDDGLVIKFNAVGASIESIKWKNTQIAKDGFVVGRCANRIAEGKFTLNGVNYNLTQNNNGNHLHGGNGSGWNSWRGPFATNAWTKVNQTPSSITYSFHSADGDQGYPGNMDMTVTYTLDQSGELSIEYFATSDQDTLCNPTNHLFMAMNGNNSYNNINLWIDADYYTPLVNSIPTGEIASVTGTKFDYTTERAFDSSQSYDDNYALNGEGYRHVATLTGTSLGYKVDVYTDRPGLQLYKESSGNICLETQLYPDAVHHDNFPSAVLTANTEFYSKTAYLFSETE